MEVFNECFTLLLIYFAFCFTPLVQSVRHQYMIGFLFIGGMVVCIGTHLFFIFKDMIEQLILSFKRYRNKKRNPHLFQEEEEDKYSTTYKIKDKLKALFRRDRSEVIAENVDNSDLPENNEQRLIAISNL